MKENLFFELIPVSKWNEHYSYPTVGAIRQLIFYNPNNFVGKVIRRIGRRLYIKTSDFFNWIEETNNKRLLQNNDSFILKKG